MEDSKDLMKIEELEAEIAELKEKLENTKARYYELQEQFSKAKSTITQCNKQIGDLRYKLKGKEDLIKDICYHDGETKNGICLDCGGDTN